VRYVEERFYRRAEAGREPRHLPADLYNLATVLRRRQPKGCLFVPIRSLQYLAVLDEEEFIFVDREHGRFIELAWREFRARERAALDEPVAYQAVFYSPGAQGLMARLQGEFSRALRELEQRQPHAQQARVIKLDVGD
jgi:hypothetical protein